MWSCERHRGYPTRWPRARPSGHTRLAARAQTEGEWVSMRPTGALPFQEDWKGLHTAGRYPTPPFQLMQCLRPCVHNSCGSTSVDSDPTHPWRPKALQEMRIRVRKRTGARGEFGSQGGRHKVSMACGQRCHRCYNIHAVKEVNVATHLTAQRKRIPRMTRSTTPARCGRRRATGSTSCTWRRRPSC